MQLSRRMAFLQLQTCILVALFTNYGHLEVSAQDICEKFNIGGPCKLLKPQTNDTSNAQTPLVVGNPYCSLACSQGDAELFSDLCHCPSAVTESATTKTLTSTTQVSSTTTISTTTRRPVTCYYSTQRPARLSNVARRMYSSTPVLTECDYPGVVTLFRDNKGQLTPACMAVLMDVDALIINSKNCKAWVQNTDLYVMADSYRSNRATKTISVNRSSLKLLDESGTLKDLYTVKLNGKLRFNAGCTQPVCVPNINIPATDIDLNDCRIIGLGYTTNKLSDPVPPQLNEIKVKVSSSSISKTNLTITRVDKRPAIACLGDDSAPLICPHITSGEWITVGVTISVGYPCETSGLTNTVVTSLLGEAKNKAYYNAILANFKYADPNVFAAAESNI
uniref:Peptidase S1 domain-containing protein n=1 Tax=Arion vulgaris TaxID=1028688 RepID=A0A0B6ZUM8_9EUPU